MFLNISSGADFNYASKPARLMCSPLNVPPHHLCGEKFAYTDVFVVYYCFYSF